MLRQELDALCQRSLLMRASHLTADRNRRQAYCCSPHRGTRLAPPLAEPSKAIKSTAGDALCRTLRAIDPHDNRAFSYNRLLVLLLQRLDQNASLQILPTLLTSDTLSQLDTLSAHNLGACSLASRAVALRSYLAVCSICGALYTRHPRLPTDWAPVGITSFSPFRGAYTR